MRKEHVPKIWAKTLLILGLFFVCGSLSAGSAQAATVTVGQTASKASSTYFYYAPGARNAYSVINNAANAAAAGATTTSHGVVLIENATSPYITESHILAKANVDIVGASRNGVTLKIASGLTPTAYGGPGTTGWGGTDSAQTDGALINVWTGQSNVKIANLTLDGSCGDYYACSNDDRGHAEFTLMNVRADNVLIDNVAFTRGKGDGIIARGDNMEVMNSVFNMVGHDFIEGYSIQNLKFHNNIGAMRTNSGVRCAGSGSGCYIYNNEFYTGTGGGAAVELQNSFSNVKIYNNYFHDISGSGGNYGAIGYPGQSPTGSGHEYYNNLFVNMPYAIAHVPSSAVSHHNIMINCSTTVGGGSDQNNIKTTSGYVFAKFGTNGQGNTYWTVTSGSLASAFTGRKIGIDALAGGSGNGGGSDTTTKYALNVTGGTGTTSCTSGTQVTITANVPSGKVFDKWTGDTSCVADPNSATTTVTMPGSAVNLTATFKDPTVVTPVDNGFPYPRGTNIPYGMMGWETGTSFLTDQATLVHFGWTTSITPSAFVANVNKAKSLGISKYLIATGGPQMSTESFWQEVKAAGITDDDFLGVYFPDEPGSSSTIITMYNAMKKYFPKAVAGDYLGDMSGGSGSAFIPGLDVCYFTTYTKFHPDRPHAWVHGNLIANGPVWKNAGKTIWSTTEALRESVSVVSSDPDLSTSQRVKDRHVSQIVMGILGGAQGVFSYAYKYTAGTPNYQGFVEFRPRYEQLWPWIMKGDRALLTTNVTSGVKSINSTPGGTIPAVTAYLFTDASGRKLVGSSSMLDFTEAGSTANNATITGVPNGTYEVLWENRTITVTNGTISDTWQPYGYHFYQLKTSGTDTTKYTLTINGGSGDGTYAAGAKVSITAGTAPSGQVFDKWTGCDTCVASTTSATTTVMMPAANTTLTATYKTAPVNAVPTLTASLVNNIITSVEKGATDVQLLSVNLCNNGAEDIKVTTVTISGSYDAANVKNVTLYSDGISLGTPTSLTDLSAKFSALNLTIRKGDCVTLALKGDIVSTTTRSSMTYSVTGSSLATGTGVTSGTAAKTAFSGTGYTTLYIKTATATTGSLAATSVANTVTNVKAGDVGVQLVAYKITNNGSENLLINKLIFTGDFSSTGVSKNTLYINEKNVGPADSTTASGAIFSTLEFVIAKGETFTFTLKGDVSGSASAGTKCYALSATAGSYMVKGMTSGKNATMSVTGSGSCLNVQGGLVDGAIIRAFGDIDIYIVKLMNGKMFKRLILSPSVFSSYQHLKWENVVVIDQSVLDQYTTSNLVYVVGNQDKTWLLQPYGDTGMKNLLIGEYDPDSVYEINATDFNSYIG